MHQRRHGRVHAAGVVTRLRSLGLEQPGLIVENLSLGGAYVRSAQPLEVGVRVGLELRGPGLNRLLLIPGQVVSRVRRGEPRSWHEPEGMGIAFLSLGREDQTQLATLLERLSPHVRVLDGDAPPRRPGAAVAPAAPPVVAGHPYFEPLRPGELLGDPEADELMATPRHLSVVAGPPAVTVQLVELATLACHLADAQTELDLYRTQLARARAENARLRAGLHQPRHAPPKLKTAS